MSAANEALGSSATAGLEAMLPLAWLAFCIVMLGAAAIDLLAISAPQAGGRLGSFPAFARQIIFWLLIGALFNTFIWSLFGRAAAGAWFYGYVLEYVLSIDNLFVFQAVFRSYATPASQVERALFWGVSAAIFLRLAFFGVGTELLGMGLLARCAFGLALLYSGVKTLRSSEDEENDDPTQNPVVGCVARLLPLHASYADDAAFFVRAPRASAGGRPESAVIGNAGYSMTEPKTPAAESAASSPSRFLEESEVGSAPPLDAGDRSLKVTPLFLVVVSLGIIDVVFAVDSVTAKISSITGWSDSLSFFLNLSSSAFAMFVLRSLFAVVSLLSRMFRFLNYGVGIVLVLIGVKLMLSGYVEVGMSTSCGAILAILFASILASVVFPGSGQTSEHTSYELRASEGRKGVEAEHPPTVQEF